MNSRAVYEDRGTEEGRLADWAARGILYAFIDPFFEVPFPVEVVALDMRDTEPTFFEMIAWDQVVYEPPTLVKVDPTVLAWIRNSLSTERWGLFVTSELSLQSLARHFQKFVIAKGPDGNPYFLRFHDAAVLDVLIKTWDAKERSVFFGPAMAFGLPDLDSLEVRIEENPFKGFSMGLGEHHRRVVALPAPEDCLLQLREAQLRSCGEAIDKDLVKLIYWHLRNHHAQSVLFLERGALEARIGLGIEKARRYGLGTVADLAAFSALMFELAPNFDDHPNFRRVLADPELRPETKMRKLSQTVTDRDWKEAAKLYDKTFWGLRLRQRK